jgi:hypothetical protein
MKFGLSVVLLAAAADALPQIGLGGASLALVSATQEKPKLRPTAKRTVFKYGPIDLAARDVSC